MHNIVRELPDVIVVAWPCTAFSPMQNLMKNHTGYQAKLDQKMKEAMPLVEFKAGGGAAGRRPTLHGGEPVDEPSLAHTAGTPHGADAVPDNHAHVRSRLEGPGVWDARAQGYEALYIFRARKPGIGIEVHGA